MVIMFEPFIRQIALVYQLPNDSWILLAEIKQYIEERLRPLKDEIDAEEAEQADKSPCRIIVHFPRGIEFQGYEKQLLDKMKGCLEKSERDLQFLWFRFDDKAKSLLGRKSPIE
jgi:hypothetical protein